MSEAWNLSISPEMVCYLIGRFLLGRIMVGKKCNRCSQLALMCVNAGRAFACQTSINRTAPRNRLFCQVPAAADVEESASSSSALPVSYASRPVHWPSRSAIDRTGATVVA